MTAVEAFIAQALVRCRRISDGVDELSELLGRLLPYQGSDLEQLGVIERTASVAFLKRFEQLQDVVGRTARAIVLWEGSPSDLTQRDIADWLEKRAVVDEAQQWMVAVRLRNRLVHEYPIEEAEQVRRLNETWSLMPLLQDAALRLGDYARGKGLCE